MTNPIQLDALDAWWTEHGNGDRRETINASPVDHALVLFNSFKELQRQGRAPEGYDLDNPSLIECARVTNAALESAWLATHGQPPVAPTVADSATVPEPPRTRGQRSRRPRP